MATGTNGIATIADCTNKGLTCSGYSDTSYCPTYSEFVSVDYTSTAVTVSSEYEYTTSSGSNITVNSLTTTLSEALPFTLYCNYTAYNSSGTAVSKTVTVSAGSTTITTSSPFGSYVMDYSKLLIAPKIGITSSDATSNSLEKYHQYTITKQLTLS